MTKTTTAKVTTTYTTTKVNGAGRILAKGFGKQKSMPYDHSITVSQNHGRAAAALVRSQVSVDAWDRVAHSARYVFIDNKHVFEFDL